jgi:hypothetical protein
MSVPRTFAGVPLAALPILKRQDLGGPAVSRHRAPAMTQITRTQKQWGGVEEVDKHEHHDVDLARAIGAKLSEAFPGHPWFVEVDSVGGMVHISIPALMHNWRFNLRLRDLASDPGWKAVIKAGGEILERWNIPRSTIDVAAFNAALTRKLHGHRDKPPT